MYTDFDRAALAFHASAPAGKIQCLVSKPIANEHDLALCYSPGVAAPVRAIATDPEASHLYTNRGNLVAVVTNGTAILGMGNLGPHAAKPVMEGKAALFKVLADIDAIDLEIATEDVTRFISVVSALEPSFGGINLEDIRAPDCFDIEERLQAAMSIPIFHDDQHGTAIVVAAALLKALKQTGRLIGETKIVISGAGAAGIACATTLLEMGADPALLWLCDIHGVLHADRRDLNRWSQRFARNTEARMIAEVAAGADVLIGVSAAGAFTPQMIEQMAPRPIVFALANPDPEIMPEAVLAIVPDAIVATGRSDRPNQINNVLAFPFIFRGALDARARRITPAMRAAAVNALAGIPTNPGSLLPSPFDPRLREMIPPAVAAAAALDISPRTQHRSTVMRTEGDPLGTIEVPNERLFGAQTQRAVTNFPLSGIAVSSIPELIKTLAWVKKAAALANMETGELSPEIGQWIVRACDEVSAGRWDAEFVVDVLQGGAGTSTNMNANEVIANRALELAGFRRADYSRIHPNDHVNRSQSTNDAYATAVRLSVHEANKRLLIELGALATAMEVKASQFDHIPKLARTQLQDAVPMTLGQEFRAFAATIAEDAERGAEMGPLFLEVNLGGTAIGTGAGASDAYRALVIGKLQEVSGLSVVPAKNLIEASWDMGAFVLYSGYLKRVASKLSKIANDLRLLSSGPRGGFGEIALPQRQPGSSLMPGKVNPVIPEAVNAAAFRVFGLDTAVTFAAEAGQLQLNAFEPVIVSSIHEGVQLLANAIRLLIDNCLIDLTADAAACRRNLEASMALATHLVPTIGYGRAAEVAKLALQGGTLRDAVIALEPASLGILDEAVRSTRSTN